MANAAQHPRAAAPDMLPADGRPCDFVSRNLRIRGRRTSIRLERALWQALEDIAHREGQTIRELCTVIDTRRRDNSLTAAVRLFIIRYFHRLAATQMSIQPGMADGRPQRMLLDEALKALD